MFPCLSVLQVSFKAPHSVASLRQAERLAWWDSSKRLSHGTLVMLWAEPDGPDNPVLVVAQIVQRDACQLAAVSEHRPTLGLR